MVALGSSPLDLGHFFTDVNVKPSSRRKKTDFTSSVTLPTPGCTERHVRFGSFVVLTFLPSLEEAGAEGLGGTGLCPFPTGDARHSQVPAAWALRDWLPWGTQQRC